jgi:flagellar basal-body rod protein FlgF
MVRGLYTAATGMAVQRNKMDVLTNNITNAETTGFKEDTLVSSAFSTKMLELLHDPNVTLVGSQVGGYNFGSHIQQLYTDFSNGSYEQTGTSTDLAIQGNGFFTVETSAGERLTQAGNFTVDSNGDLVTSDGNYVLGQNGHIHVGSSDFTVASDGTITQGGTTVDKLRLETVADTTTLRKQGDNLYYIYGGGTAQTATGAKVLQGYKEGSNVNVADEMVDMLTLYRKYEANQKMVSMTDETVGLAVNKLGSVGG